MLRKLLIALAILALAGIVFWNWPRITHRDGDMRDPRSEIHAAVLGSDIYVAGGIGFFRTLASCERYDLEARSWHRCPSLPLALHHVAMAADGSRVYASGGYDGLPFQQHEDAGLYALEPGGEQWTRIADLPHPIGQHAMAWHDGTLYLVGGQNGEADLATLWAYDLATGEWARRADMPTPRHSHAIAIAGDTLFVAGGRSAALGTEIDRVEAYDLTADSWRALPPLPEGRGGHAAFVRNGTLHVVGGESLTAGRVMDRHDILDLATLAWREGPPLAQGRHGLAAIESGGRAYAIGGGAQPGMQTIYSVTGTIFSIEIND